MYYELAELASAFPVRMCMAAACDVSLGRGAPSSVKGTCGLARGLLMWCPCLHCRSRGLAVGLPVRGLGARGAAWRAAAACARRGAAGPVRAAAAAQRSSALASPPRPRPAAGRRRSALGSARAAAAGCARAPEPAPGVGAGRRGVRAVAPHPRHTAPDAEQGMCSRF